MLYMFVASRVFGVYSRRILGERLVFKSPPPLFFYFETYFVLAIMRTRVVYALLPLLPLLKPAYQKSRVFGSDSEISPKSPELRKDRLFINSNKFEQPKKTFELRRASSRKRIQRTQSGKL